MIEEQRGDIGFMVRTTGELVRENLALVVIAILLLSAVDVAQDRLPDLGRAGSVPSLLLSLVLEYQLVLTALMRRGYTERGPRARFWALLGLSLVSGIAVLLGFVLLVVPGIYLLIRWSVAVPVLIGEGAGVFESLRRSAEELEGRFWPVLGFSLLFWMTFLVAAALGVGLAFFPRDGSLAGSILVNVMVNAALVTHWLGAVAIYVGGRPPPSIADVFA